MLRRKSVAPVFIIGGALCLFGLAPAMLPAPAHAQNAVTASDITIETEFATYTIKQISLSGTSLTKSDLDSLLDPKSPAPLAERFGKLTASEVTIPELTVTTKNTPVEKTTYQNVKLTDVKQGRVASAEVEAARFSEADPNTGPIEGNYGHIRMHGFDLALAARVMSEARKDDALPLKTLYDDFSVEGFKLETAGKEPLSMTIASMTGRNVKARPFATRPADFQKEGSEPAQVAPLMKDILASIDMDGIAADGIALRAVADDGKPVVISIAKMSMGKMSGGKIEDIDFSQNVIDVQGSSVKIADVDLKDIDFPHLREFTAKPVAKEADDSEANTAARAAMVPTIMQFAVTKIDVTAVDEKTANKVAFSIDKFQVNGGALAQSAPTQMSANLDHFLLDLRTLKEKDVRSLTDLGYSKLDMSSRVEMAWDPSSEVLAINEMSLTGVDMGTFKLSGEISNVTKDFFSGDTTAMQAAAFGALIKKIEIKVDNAGLFEKVAAAQAKAQNKSIEDIKKSYISAAAIGIPAMLDNKPAAKIIGAALAKFVANPKSFHLIATSADGLGAADFALMSDPVTILDAVEIKATANE